MSATASPSMLGNWEREARMAELYKQLAGAARNPTTRRQLEGMAADERRHAKAWAGYLEGQGIAIPPRRPDPGATALGLLARVVGVGPVMSMAGLAESQILRTYLGQMTEVDDPAAEKIAGVLILRERNGGPGLADVLTPHGRSPPPTSGTAAPGGGDGPGGAGPWPPPH